MSADSFGFGDCVAGTDRGWREARQRSVRTVFALAFQTGSPHDASREMESKPAPAPRKKVAKQ